MNETGPWFQAKIFLRSDDCNILSHEDQCLNCKNKEQSLQKPLKTKDAKEATPVSSKAPLTVLVKKGWLQQFRGNALFVNNLKSESAGI